MTLPFIKDLRLWRHGDLPEAFPVAPPPVAPFMPQQLGQYEVVREIGRGSMGVVYLGRDQASGNAVALKIMRLAEGLDAKVRGDAKQRFMREA